MTEGNPVVFVFLYIRYLQSQHPSTTVLTSRNRDVTDPASCASCALMIERRLFRSKKLQAAVYLHQSASTQRTTTQKRGTDVKKKLHPRTWLCMKLSEVFSFPKSSTVSAQSKSHISPDVGGSLNLLIWWSQLISQAQNSLERRAYLAEVIKSMQFW